MTGFYADRSLQYLFSDMGTLAVQQKIPSNYLQKGIVRMVPDIGTLQTMIREGGFYLLPKNVFATLQVHSPPLPRAGISSSCAAHSE